MLRRHAITLVGPLLAVLAASAAADVQDDASSDALAVVRTHLTTPPSPAAQSLQRRLDAAVATGASRVTIPPGDYRFGNASLLLTGAQDLAVIAAPGATLWFNYSLGFVLSGCANVTVSGVTIDYDPPNFAQGIVTAVSATNATQFTAAWDPRYLMPDGSVAPPFARPGGLKGAKVGFFEPDTLQLMYHGNQFMAASHRVPRRHGSASNPGDEAPGDDDDGVLYEITLQSRLQGAPVPNKTLVAIWPRGGSTYLLHNSSHVTTNNLTIHGAGNMAVVEDHGDGHHVHNGLRIVRRAQNLVSTPLRRRTPGAFADVHLLASNADGFHSNCAQAAPILEGCEISHTGDDFFNVHNRMLVLLNVVAPSNASAYVIETDNGETLQRVAEWKSRGGSWAQLQLYHLNTLNRLASPVVSSLQQVHDPSVLARAKQAYATMQAPPYKAGLVRPFPDTNVWLVNFSAPLAAVVPPFSLVNYDAASNAGAVVHGCHMHDGYSRVMLIKSINATVTDCVLERAGGVHISPEQPWLEGTLGLRNVVFENNTLVDCGDHAVSQGPGTSNITVAHNTCSPTPCP